MVFISNAAFLAVTCVLFDVFSTFNIVSTSVRPSYLLPKTTNSSTHSSTNVFLFFNIVSQVMLVFSAIVYVGSYQFMSFMARAKYTDSGQLIDSGVDLNMEGGVAE